MRSGDIIGQYNILRLIGRGGSGEVYLARDIRSNERVAIKTLSPHAAINNPESFRRFLLEAEALRQLNHPNIVNLLDTLEFDGRYALVLEYIPGGSLWALLARQPQLPIIHVLLIALGLADALKQSHSLNIVHRDIKPANILIGEGSKPYLTDFGLVAMLEAQQNEEITPEGSLLGSYSYLSPEAVNSLPAQPSMDIWSLGVVIYEMLAGARPFTGDKPASIIFRIMTDEPDDLISRRPDAPPELVTLIQEMLVKNPDERLPDSRALLNRIIKITQDLSDEQRAEYQPQLEILGYQTLGKKPNPIWEQLQTDPTLQLADTINYGLPRPLIPSSPPPSPEIEPDPTPVIIPIPPSPLSGKPWFLLGFALALALMLIFLILERVLF